MSRKAWAIEFVGSPLDGHRRWLAGGGLPAGALLFKTRRAAREWIEEFRRQNAWTLTGGWACQYRGNRIYKSASPVKVAVRISICG